MKEYMVRIWLDLEKDISGHVIVQAKSKVRALKLVRQVHPDFQLYRVFQIVDGILEDPEPIEDDLPYICGNGTEFSLGF